ncbi:hypothetical protein [Mycobacterium heidelbergense]|nr:hypothetical protein [Mycobacterium heidelbergense]
MLIGRAQDQFADLIDHPSAYDALMERIIRLADTPWDAWPVYPDDQPDYRETQFGEHGLLSFRVDDNAELLIIFNILWTG